jgi:hypothetical protein
MKRIPAIAGSAVVFAMLLAAQVPVDTQITLYEAGNEVGQVYRGPGDANARFYVEHWVLYPTYVYPGPRTLAVLELAPQAVTAFESEQDFFRNAHFPKGSKYMRVTAEEFNELPRGRY